MDNKNLETYIEEFKNLDLEEIRKRVRDYINVYTPQSKSNDIYRAYQVIKAKRYEKEAESVKNDINACINLMTSNYISTPFICKETKESLTTSEAINRCLDCAKCPCYKAAFAVKENFDEEPYRHADKNEPLSLEEQKEPLSLEEQKEPFDNDDIKNRLKYYDQEDYHNLYYTKLFNEFDMSIDFDTTTIYESILHFLEENYPAYHKTNKIIAVLKKTLNDRDTARLEYITYNDMENRWK